MRTACKMRNKMVQIMSFAISKRMGYIPAGPRHAHGTDRTEQRNTPFRQNENKNLSKNSTHEALHGTNYFSN